MIGSLDTLYQTQAEERAYFQAIFFTKDLQLFKNTSILICTYTGPVNWAFVSSLLILIDAFHLCLIDQKAHFHIHK